eukprot:1534234-Karenia_brevis.AAC.1
MHPSGLFGALAEDKSAPAPIQRINIQGCLQTGTGVPQIAPSHPSMGIWTHNMDINMVAEPRTLMRDLRIRY